MIPTNQRQEALSRGYVQLVAARAGLICLTIEQDFGFDMILRAVETRGQQVWDSGPQIDLQVRSTTRAERRNSEVLYDLDVRTYRILRDVAQHGPCILVLVVLPEEEAQWVRQSEQELTLRRCAYWASFRDAPPTENESDPRNHPASERLLAEAAQRLTQRRSGTTP
jgi:hypothetical protein